MAAIKKCGVVAAAGALALAACGSGDGDSETWNFTVTTGNTSTWHEGAEAFAEEIEERTDGRITLSIYANEQLSGGDPAAGVEQLMSGEKEMSFNSTIIYAGIDPRFGAINAPFLYDDLDQARAAIDNGALDAYIELGAEHDVHVLGLGESGFRQLTNSVRPIESPEDLAGIKVRIPGIGLFTDIYRGLGADPSTMNFAEVFTSLQQGTIDGQENPIDVIHSSGLEEVQQHLTIWNYVYDPLILGISKDLFDSLSEEDQRAVEEAAEIAIQVQIDSNREKEAEQLAELDEVMDVVELTPEQVDVFRDAVAPLHEQYADTWGQDLVDAVSPGEGQ